MPKILSLLACLCLQEADEQTAIQTVHAAYAAGINFFDVSPYYGSGRAEQVGGCLCL
jgi:aryl-alcohol dehydrogenase-like predicted oxidoreductase